MLEWPLVMIDDEQVVPSFGKHQEFRGAVEACVVGGCCAIVSPVVLLPEDGAGDGSDPALCCLARLVNARVLKRGYFCFSTPPSRTCQRVKQGI